MRNLRSVSEIGEKQITILRIDCDLPINKGRILDNSRLIKSVGTIRLLLEKGNKIMIIGHMGRPKPGQVVLGKPENYDIEYSLRPVYLELMSILEENGSSVESVFLEDILERGKIAEAIEVNQILFFENLRFWKDEEENNHEFLRYVMEIASCFVNDAFAVAHRENASITLWQKMETYYGLSFIEEVAKIDKALTDPERPLTVVLGGAKKDKLDYLEELANKADWVLVGGKLPLLLEPERIGTQAKVMVAKLTENKLDIDEESRKKFSEIISNSKTVIWAGAMGYYEDSENRRGTKEIAWAVANCQGYKIVAGGDTSSSIQELGLKDRIDLICSGGGVLLELMTKGRLPAWEEGEEQRR